MVPLQLRECVHTWGCASGSPSFRCKYCSHIPVYALRDCAFPRGLHRLLPRGGGSAVWLRGLASRGAGGVQQVWAGACAPGDDGAHLPRVLVGPSACSVPGSEVLGFSERVPVRHGRAEVPSWGSSHVWAARGRTGGNLESVSVFPFADELTAKAGREDGSSRCLLGVL